MPYDQLVKFKYLYNFRVVCHKIVGQITHPGHLMNKKETRFWEILDFAKIFAKLACRYRPWLRRNGVDIDVEYTQTMSA